jgi:TatD DNase family protein
VIFETHAHVHDPVFDGDRASMLQRARDAGVERIVTVGCDLADSARALAVASEHGLDWSLGIHPHEAKDAPADLGAAFDAAIARAARPPLAIGETGLDFFYGHSPREAQREVMRVQVRYARDRAMPLIFHQRDAFDEFVAVLREEWRPEMRGVVHCFTGDTAQARCFVDEFGLRLGIGGVLTFKTAEALRQAVLAVGLAPIVLETDCPYLAPAPYRGKRNEPAFIAQTAEALAQLLETPHDTITTTTAATARALFRTS